MLNIGDVLDNKYRVVSLLGKGGMGYVYLAENIKLGNKWAVKEVTVSKNKKTGIQIESEILKRLNHRSLPRIVDLIEYKNNLYIVEDYFEGANLKEIIKTKGACKEENVLKWAVQLCDILHYLHSFKPNPIIYRDMKPGNIIIDKQNNVKLVDLGIAREYREENDSDTLYIGTRGYAAPEQYAGNQQTDERTDIYGLGATLYHALTGISPNAPPYKLVPVRQVNKSLSAHIERIIIKCTQNDPALRYQSVRELTEDLKRIGVNGCSNAPDRAPRYSGVVSKLVMMGSLSPRAGSSFLAANLAAVLASRNIPTAVIEFPINSPYLYDALFLRQKITDKFCSWPHEIRKGNKIDRHSCFTEEGITWIVTDPALQPVKEWSDDNMMQLLYLVKHIPVVILDISCNWNHACLKILFSQADYVFLVIDPDPVLMDRMALKPDEDVDQEENPLLEFKIIQLLTEMNKKNGNINLIINKYSESIRCDQIYFPIEPIVCFPFLDPAKVYKSLWDGEILYRNSEYKKIFQDKLQPVIEKIVPQETSCSRQVLKEGIFKRVKAACKLLAGEWGRQF